MDMPDWDGWEIADLVTQETNLTNAIANRLAGNGTATTATEEVAFGGLALRAVPLETLYRMLSQVKHALQKRRGAPGTTFTQACLS